MANRRDKPRYPHPPDRGRAPGLDEVIALAKKVTDATGCPVVGGVAVALHGGGRFTRDIDIYSNDPWDTHQKLEGAGMYWNSERREHVIEGVAVHMVQEDSLGGPPKHISTVSGVKVISLADLVRAKLTVGLESMRRSKDITHVIDLIERVPLKKNFAGKLPTKLRAPFKALVEQVHGPQRTALPTMEFWKKYA